MKGLSDTITAVKYSKDIKSLVDDPSSGWHDIVEDGAKDGFGYVFKKLAPRAAEAWAKVSEGPVGWFLSLTLQSSSTQTAAQDFDPTNVLNNPKDFSFDDRVKALQKLYESEARHPEVWTNSRRRQLYRWTEQIYNSPDNPNIQVAPQ